MDDKKVVKISLKSYIMFIIIIIILVAIIGALVFHILKNNHDTKNTELNNTQNSNILENDNLDTESNNSVTENKNDEQENINKTEDTINDYFILYNGYEMSLEIGVQYLGDMELNSENKEKYNTTYYNYEDGRYIGETEGNLEETYEGVAIVGNVSRIAISEKYDVLPRTYTEINELPEELKDLADYTTVDIHSIDLDGDEKEEYVVCYTINYEEGAIGDGEPQASSAIMLFDSNYQKISNLVILENGFWANIKEEERKVFLSLDDIDYIDIDNDGIIEMIISVPTYDAEEISIVKYNNNKIEGETDLQASLIP